MESQIELRSESVYPDENVLKSVLEESYLAYLAFLELFDKNAISYEWRYYKDGNAWLCKIMKKKKTLVWASAWRGYMKATIYFPAKFLSGMGELDIPTATKDFILNSKNVGKSKACIFEIRDKEKLESFNELLQIKMKYK